MVSVYNLTVILVFYSGIKCTCKELFAKAGEKVGEQAESLYSPDADLTELTEALHQASEKAKERVLLTALLSITV